MIITTLALGSWLKQGLAKAWAKREAWESQFTLLGVQKSVREWTFTLPNELPLWELESWWIVGVKPHWIEDLFISLKRYWNVDV